MVKSYEILNPLKTNLDNSVVLESSNLWLPRWLDERLVIGPGSGPRNSTTLAFFIGRINIIFMENYNYCGNPNEFQWQVCKKNKLRTALRGEPVTNCGLSRFISAYQ